MVPAGFVSGLCDFMSHFYFRWTAYNNFDINIDLWCGWVKRGRSWKSFRASLSYHLIPFH